MYCNRISRCCKSASDFVRGLSVSISDDFFGTVWDMTSLDCYIDIWYVDWKVRHPSYAIVQLTMFNKQITWKTTFLQAYVPKFKFVLNMCIFTSTLKDTTLKNGFWFDVLGLWFSLLYLGKRHAEQIRTQHNWRPAESMPSLYPIPCSSAHLDNFCLCKKRERKKKNGWKDGVLFESIEDKDAWVTIQEIANTLDIASANISKIWKPELGCHKVYAHRRVSRILLPEDKGSKHQSISMTVVVPGVCMISLSAGWPGTLL